MILFYVLYFLFRGDFVHQALYRKWRPSTFSDVVGQEHITSVLSYEAKEGTLNHAYLFCGSRGTGKTSCAKILAKAANCRHLVGGNPCNECDSCRSIDIGTSLDVLEMDAASNTGVDYIRDIREEVIFTPSELGTRVYIIDEVHMLSEGAFNALLKILEEPPSRVIFILATTELQKIPATILSRCQRFDFRRIPVTTIMERLFKISEEENISLTEDGARLIAKLSQGGMRDAISMLELCAADGEPITSEKVEQVSGVVGKNRIVSVIRSIQKKDIASLLETVSEIHRSSRDLSVFMNDLSLYYRDMMVQKVLGGSKPIPKSILDVSDQEAADLRDLASHVKYSTLVYHSNLLESAFLSMSRGVDKRVCTEMTLVRMAGEAVGDSKEAIAAKISDLEEKVTRCLAGMIDFSSPDSSVNSNVKGESIPRIKEKEDVSLLDTEKTPSQQNLSVSSSDCTDRKEYTSWSELVTEYEKIDKGGAAFLRDAEAEYDSTGKLFVMLKDSFGKTLLQSSQAPKALRSLAFSIGDRFSDVELVVKINSKQAKNIFDDLF
jgi:DNA polymerase-3 subunit gamma/tau